MSYIDFNPRVAWAEAFESGIRTQACADLAEAGAKVQTSGAKSGGCYNDHYQPIYSVIRRMEREAPVLAAVGHWLCLSDTGAANQHLDDVADTVLTRLMVATPEWSTYRKARRQRIEGLILARMVQERNDMDGSHAHWSPKAICDYLAGHMGITIVSDNWKRDDWDKTWAKLGGILADLEDEAMQPVAEAARKANKAARDFERQAA